MQEYQSPSYFYVWYRQYDNSEFYLVWVDAGVRFNSEKDKYYKMRMWISGNSKSPCFVSNSYLMGN